MQPPTNQTPTPERAPKKERLTVHIPPELADRLRNAVFYTPGLTLADLAEEALRAQVDAMEEDRGEPFPPRSAALKTGRPLK